MQLKGNEFVYDINEKGVLEGEDWSVANTVNVFAIGKLMIGKKEIKIIEKEYTPEEIRHFPTLKSFSVSIKEINSIELFTIREFHFICISLSKDIKYFLKPYLELGHNITPKLMKKADKKVVDFSPVLSSEIAKAKERINQEEIAQQKLEKEKQEKERLENERIEREKQERERLEKERIEKEKIEKERLEKERLYKEKFSPEKEKERLENLISLFQISERVNINDIALILGLERAEVLKRLIEWRKHFEVKLDGDYINIKTQDVNALMSLLDKSYETWSSDPNKAQKKE